MLLQKISQILTTIGDISSIQEEYILIAIRSIEEQKFCVQDELEEIKHPRKMLDSKIGKIPLCAPLDFVYSQKNSYHESMAEEEV